MYSSTNYSGTIGAHKMNMHIWNYAAKAGDTLRFKRDQQRGLKRLYIRQQPERHHSAGLSGNRITSPILTSVTGNFFIFVGDARRHGDLRQ